MYGSISIKLVVPLCMTVLISTIVSGVSTSNVPKLKGQIASNPSSPLLTFGNTFPIAVSLPTPDVIMARKYLSDPNYIIETSWPSGTYKPMAVKGSYKLGMGTFSIPGIQTIIPEIDAYFSVDPETGFINMKSGEWSITGSGQGILNDSNFMNSFQIVSLICLFYS